MILQEDSCRAQSKSSEAVKTGAFKAPPPQTGIEYAWDINDTTLPKDIPCEDFQDWPNGHCKHIYRDECEDARKHMSNWAMRNTNNHNVNILKKSCLGVLVCSLRCTLENGDIVHVRPAICDKARRKQLGKPCPSTRCSGRLELLPCRGHGGYPVTHFWRHTHGRIFFQAKGEHDHPHPEAKSSAEARRQRYAIKENRASHISRHKRRAAQSLLPGGSADVPIKQESKANLHQYPTPAKMRRICTTCTMYDCRCAYTDYTPSTDALSPPLLAHNDYKLSSSKDGVASGDSVHDYYASAQNAQNALYYATYSPYSAAYTYDKSVSDPYGSMYGNETSQWVNYPSYVSLPSSDAMSSSESLNVPSTSIGGAPEQYYMDPYVKNGVAASHQYSSSKPCMYDQHLLDFPPSGADPLLTNTVTNSIGSYDNGHDKQMSPPVGDTFVHLQRPDSYPAMPVTSSHDMTSHSNQDLHGNMSPYHQSATRSPHSSHEQQHYLVSSDSPVSQHHHQESSVPQETRMYCDSTVASSSFQLPAIAAAVGTMEQCSAFKVLSGTSSPPLQSAFISQQY